MMQWWFERQPRERLLLGTVGALVVVLALIQFALLPLLSYRAAARDQHATALALLQEIEAGARTIQAQRAIQAKRPDGSMRTLVAAAASDIGLSITRLQPVENTGLDVWLDNVGAQLMYAWIARLQDQGVPVVRAVIQRTDDATVSAQITFAVGTGS